MYVCGLWVIVTPQFHENCHQVRDHSFRWLAEFDDSAGHVVHEITFPFAVQLRNVTLAKHCDFVPARSSVSVVEFWWCLLLARFFSASLFDAFREYNFSI